MQQKLKDRDFAARKLHSNQQGHAIVEGKRLDFMTTSLNVSRSETL